MTRPLNLRPLDTGLWELPTLEAARELLGKIVVRELHGVHLTGRIVETEAYVQDDPASHSFRGKTPRNAPMFGPPGIAYVYFTYGNHFCLNFVTGQDGRGEAVLIRAMEPLEGLGVMARLRGRDAPRDLLSGPGKLCMGLSIDRGLNFHPLNQPPMRVMEDGWSPGKIASRPRIGISVSQDRPWRFYPEASLQWVSRK